MEFLESNTMMLVGLCIPLLAIILACATAWIQTRRVHVLERQINDICESEPRLAEASRIKEELETKRRQLAEIEKEAAQNKELVERGAQLRAEIAELENKSKGLEELRQSLAKLDQEAKQAVAKVLQAEEAERQSRKQKEDQERALGELRSATQSARSEFESAQGKLGALQGQIPELEAEVDEKRASVASLRTRQEELGGEVSDLEGRRANAISRAEDIEEREALNDRKIAEVKEIDTELAIKKSRLREKLSDLKIAEDRLGEISGGASSGDNVDAMMEVRSRLGDLWRPQFERNTTSQENDEKRALDGVKSYLKGHGLIFHERTVLGFHTALKTGREAPLLILAGISGTGKSLLPRRYAESIGMNMLMIPVQPRWDGPQDLLGFYHHLENKYVATDLIRALVQMHPYSADDNWAAYQTRPEEHLDLSEQMLLVLLDEMNVARIEYYFSEFLSRLETRRAIYNSVEDSTQRESASIPIECGHLHSGVDNLSVFPDLNTLFVGTMNEDESTQSISDKVVDRANIMRFSKPESMVSDEPESPPSPTGSRLSRSTWDSWCKQGKLNKDEQNEVNTVFTGINDLLQNVQRPFGHRLLSAANAYIENYPSFVADRVKCGIADQLEMRILPRLRGIDLGAGDGHAHNVINHTIAIAKECKDTDLASAIEEARDVAQRSLSSQRFHWSGVARKI